MNKNLKTTLMAGANLAVNATVAIMSSQVAHANVSLATNPSQDSAMASMQTNAVSIASIEKSFLEIPGVCKARNAAFDPVEPGHEEISSKILALHHLLDGADGVAA